MMPLASVTPIDVVTTVLRPATATLTGAYWIPTPYWLSTSTFQVVEPAVAERTLAVPRTAIEAAAGAR